MPNFDVKMEESMRRTAAGIKAAVFDDVPANGEWHTLTASVKRVGDTLIVGGVSLVPNKPA